jgi:hypothetical protein
MLVKVSKEFLRRGGVAPEPVSHAPATQVANHILLYSLGTAARMAGSQKCPETVEIGKLSVQGEAQLCLLYLHQ